MNPFHLNSFSKCPYLGGVPSLKRKKKKKKSVWGAKTHTFSTAFPSVWRAAACFLTVCKIELDTVGNLTSRQTCIFFSPQVLVFLVFPSLPPPGFLSCNCHQTLCPRTDCCPLLSLQSPPSSVSPSHPTVSNTRNLLPSLHNLSLSPPPGSSHPATNVDLRPGMCTASTRGRVCYQLKVSM